MFIRHDEEGGVLEYGTNGWSLAEDLDVLEGDLFGSTVVGLKPQGAPYPLLGRFLRVHGRGEPPTMARVHR